MKKKWNRLAAMLLALTMLLALAACGQSGTASTGQPTPAPVSQAPETPAPTSSQPDPDDLTVVRSMQLQYANNFAVDYCANGCKIITDAAGQRFLWIPEGGQTPQDTGDMVVLQAPLTKIGCWSSTHATLFHAIGALDRVNLVTTKPGSWYIEEIAAQLDSGLTTYVGKRTEPDYELVTAAGPQLIITSTTDDMDEVLAKLDELGIPHMADSQHLENHPLGRVEWAKLVGALLDMEDEADAYFDSTVARVEAVTAQVSGETAHPLIMQTFIFKGNVYVRNGGDYVNKMLEMAGGTYPFAELEPDKSGNTKMTVEEFYKDALETEILIYDTTSDVNVSTVADILANGDYLADMKAIQEGNVWGVNKNYWQAADDVATMIEDIATIIYHPENADSLHYFYKLPTE